MNKYIVLTFKSRNYLFDCLKKLNFYGIYSKVINTPRCISTSCGLSGKIDLSFLLKLKYILNKENAVGLNGIYIVTRNGLSEKAERIY